MKMEERGVESVKLVTLRYCLQFMSTTWGCWSSSHKDRILPAALVNKARVLCSDLHLCSAPLPVSSCPCHPASALWLLAVTTVRTNSAPTVFQFRICISVLLNISLVTGSQGYTKRPHDYRKSINSHVSFMIYSSFLCSLHLWIEINMSYRVCILYFIRSLKDSSASTST